MTLSAVPPPPEKEVEPLNRVVIETLEELLEEARKGTIRGIAVAIVYVDDETSDRWASRGGLLPASMVGAIEVMKHRYVSRTCAVTEP